MRPPITPTRASCIEQLKGLELPDQVTTIRTWLNRKMIGPVLYNDLMQYIKSNHWTKDTNQTLESDETCVSEDDQDTDPNNGDTSRFNKSPAKVQGAPNTEAMMDRVEIAVQYKGGKWGWVVPAEFAANLERKLRAYITKYGE